MRTFTFDDFLETPQGSELLAWESAQFDELTEDTFGYEALQVGCPPLNTLRINRIPSQWLCDKDFELLDTNSSHENLKLIQAECTLLPFESDSIDLVTLPHTLDFADSPQQSLREAARVLHPEGRLIITAFNPLSLWWMRQQCVRIGMKTYLPTKANPIPLYRIKDWLSLLGFEIDRGRFGIYAPWCKSSNAFRRWNWLNKAGDRWAPHCSNLFILSAIKRMPGTHKLDNSPLKMAADIIRTHKPLPVSKEAN